VGLGRLAPGRPGLAHIASVYPTLTLGF